MGALPSVQTRPSAHPPPRPPAGVKVFAVGVTWAAPEELALIASPPAADHAFFVDEFEHLARCVPRILQTVCDDFARRPGD